MSPPPPFNARRPGGGGGRCGANKPHAPNGRRWTARRRSPPAQTAPAARAHPEHGSYDCHGVRACFEVSVFRCRSSPSRCINAPSRCNSPSRSTRSESLHQPEPVQHGLGVGVTLKAGVSHRRLVPPALCAGARVRRSRPRLLRHIMRPAPRLWTIDKSPYKDQTADHRPGHTWIRPTTNDQRPTTIDHRSLTMDHGPRILRRAERGLALPNRKQRSAAMSRIALRPARSAPIPWTRGRRPYIDWTIDLLNYPIQTIDHSNE